MKFKKITVDCPSDASDIISFVLHEAGSMGEVFDDYGDVKQVLEDKRWDYADAALFDPTDGCSVSGFFPVETDESVVASRINKLKDDAWYDFSAVKIGTEIIDSAEWENEWKKYYKPFNIGKIVIVPEWIKYNASCGDIPVKLNPGLAFGTGMHETTSMCVDLMQKIDIAGKRVLDFGCGSGILGICAAALGAKSVVFADTDEQAVSATVYNCKINGIYDPDVLLCDVRDIDEPADVVVANITADVLISVMPIIKAALKKGGYAIISGVISAKIDAVRDEYAKSFTVVEHERKNEWSAFLLKL